MLELDVWWNKHPPRPPPRTKTEAWGEWVGGWGWMWGVSVAFLIGGDRRSQWLDCGQDR